MQLCHNYDPQSGCHRDGFQYYAYSTYHIILIVFVATGKSCGYWVRADVNDSRVDPCFLGMCCVGGVL